MIFWSKWYREIQNNRSVPAKTLDLWFLSLICYLMDKKTETNNNSPLKEATVTVSLTELDRTVTPKIVTTEIINNIPQISRNNSNNTSQSILVNSSNWQSGYKLKDGKYTIEKELGKGGFGVTYLASDREGKQVVIKMLKNELHDRKDFKQLEEDFVNEAVKLSQFKHPNIVPIIEVINDGGWCIVMEYIRGQTLDNLVKERNSYLTSKEALHYIKQIAEALKVVHEKGLLHRDIKPQNILIREDTKEAVLIDFGLALKFNRSPVANSGGLSHGYASLEQYQFNVIWDYYTDVYALAATLYFTLTKIKPISAKERAGAKKLSPPQKLNPAIGEHLSEIIEKGMALDPASRPQTVEQWLDILQSSKKNNLSGLTLLALFLLGLGSFIVYLLLKPSINGELKFNQTLEKQCTENDLHPLTEKCQKSFYFAGRKGEQVTIEMDSDRIDPLLILLNSEGIEIAKNDDIDVNNFNAKIAMKLPKDGMYTVNTQSSQKQELGTYTLKLTKN